MSFLTKKVLFPIARKLSTTLISNEIVSVQPMQLSPHLMSILWNGTKICKHCNVVMHLSEEMPYLFTCSCGNFEVIQQG